MKRRKLKLRTRPEIPRELRACCLCGDLVLHGAVEGPGAELAFRASVDLDGTVWIALKGHSDPRRCPDPPAYTGDFWHVELKREAWKAQHRQKMEARRTIQ